jgi:pilus assembly protein CpaE
LADAAALDSLRILLISASEATRDSVDELLSGAPDVLAVAWVSQPDLAPARARDLAPHIILVDDLAGTDLPALIGQLSAGAPGAGVIALVPAEAMDLARQALLAGALAFITKPVQRDDLLAALRQVASRRALSAEEQPNGVGLGRVVVFCGSKGGTGRTTLAVNTSISLRQAANRPVVLVDADFAAPAIDVALNLRDERCLVDLLPKLARLDPQLIEGVLASHSSGIQVLLAPPPSEPLPDITMPQLQQLLLWLRRMFPWVVIDLGLPIDALAFGFLDAADHVLMSAMPEMIGLRNARRMIDDFRARGYSEDKVWLVLNRADMAGGLRVGDVEGHLGLKVRFQIPNDQSLATDTVNRGVPLVLTHRRSPLAAAYQELARQLLRSEPAPLALAPHVRLPDERPAPLSVAGAATAATLLATGPVLAVAEVPAALPDTSAAELVSGAPEAPAGIVDPLVVGTAAGAARVEAEAGAGYVAETLEATAVTPTAGPASVALSDARTEGGTRRPIEATVVGASVAAGGTAQPGAGRSQGPSAPPAAKDELPRGSAAAAGQPVGPAAFARGPAYPVYPVRRRRASRWFADAKEWATIAVVGAAILACTAFLGLAVARFLGGQPPAGEGTGSAALPAAGPTLAVASGSSGFTATPGAGAAAVAVGSPAPPPTSSTSPTPMPSYPSGVTREPGEIAALALTNTLSLTVAVPATETPAPSNTAPPTATPAPSETPVSTVTATPTASPSPTETPSPTATDTALPSPTATRLPPTRVPTPRVIPSATPAPPLSPPALLAPLSGLSSARGVDFVWQPADSLPDGAGYEVVWWNKGENPANARGIAPPIRETSLAANLDVLDASGQLVGSEVYWTVLIVRTAPYVRLTQPEASPARLLIYQHGSSSTAPAPPKPR